MSYFEDYYSRFQYTLKIGDAPGLRPAQLGAIHAAAAHFTTRPDPGIVTMPTGSGKTAVLSASAFVLRATRVLIIAPSRLVREQIVEEVESLKTLRQANALGIDFPAPRVFNAKKRITTTEEWEQLRGYDVVVGTVQSVSPAYEQIPDPPADLFDLVLVDEAHHSPAYTWQAVLDHFARARKLLFTATPFRQDQREIKGRFIFTYDLRQAYQDGIFGQIAYQPVTPADGENHDVAIARAAQQQFLRDRDAGYAHRLMVRTDSKKRAGELLALYEQHTNLQLKLVTGDKSLKYAKAVIEELRAGTLDGIVCVNMLGEGFNFPNLKIAAIHAPHRSLAVTLQFIGRFARTTGENLGPATFLAIPSEIEIEAERLYDSQAVWQEMVQNLSATRVTEEIEVREILESFEPDDFSSPDLSDLSLYGLEPYYHVKVFQLTAPIDLRDEVLFPETMQVVYRSHSDAHNAAVYITREVSLPRWTTDDRLSIVRPDLFIFYFNAQTNLLFVCASQRSAGMYDALMASFRDADPRPLPLVKVNRALNDLTTPEFFNVGMRNRVASNTTESYRIITGSNADKAINRSDGRLYHRGHVFGRATDDEGELVTIGLSSASKIWSNKSSQLPELIQWCEKLAQRISSNHEPVTQSGLDYLAVGQEISALPPNILSVDWRSSVYQNPPIVRFENNEGETVEMQLLDLDLSIDHDATTDDAVALVIQSDSGLKYCATFSFETDRFFEPATANEPEVTVESETSVDLIHFLNDEMPIFYTDDLAFIDGYSMVPPSTDEPPPFEERNIEVVDWAAHAVDIEREFGQASPGKVSIHQYLETHLASTDITVGYYDHGTGEIADFITLESIDDTLLVRFYHCKGATGTAPGHRLADISEVCGQAVKSTPWASRQRISANVRRRFTKSIGSHRFIKGDLQTLERLLAETPSARIQFEFIAVQPGLRKQDLPTELSNMLAAAGDFLVRGSFRPLRILAS